MKEISIVRENLMTVKGYTAYCGDEFFVEGSALHEAIKTGELVLPKHQGGTTNVKIKICK